MIYIIHNLRLEGRSHAVVSGPNKTVRIASDEVAIVYTLNVETLKTGVRQAAENKTNGGSIGSGSNGSGSNGSGSGTGGSGGGGGTR